MTTRVLPTLSTPPSGPIVAVALPARPTPQVMSEWVAGTASRSGGCAVRRAAVIGSVVQAMPPRTRAAARRRIRERLQHRYLSAG